MCTAIEVSTTVRRTVAFSRAVYDGTAQVEEITAILCEKKEEIEEVLSQGKIPVMIDGEGKVVEYLKLDVVVF